MENLIFAIRINEHHERNNSETLEIFYEGLSFSNEKFINLFMKSLT